MVWISTRDLIKQERTNEEKILAELHIILDSFNLIQSYKNAKGNVTRYAYRQNREIFELGHHVERMLEHVARLEEIEATIIDNIQGRGGTATKLERYLLNFINNIEHEINKIAVEIGRLWTLDRFLNEEDLTPLQKMLAILRNNLLKVFKKEKVIHRALESGEKKGFLARLKR